MVPKKDVKINYACPSSGGQVTGWDDTAAMNPAKYSITVTAADKHKHNIPCLKDIVVSK